MTKEFFPSNQLAQHDRLAEASVEYWKPPVAPYEQVVIHAPQAYEAAIGTGRLQGHIDDTIDGAAGYLKRIDKRRPNDKNPDN